MVHNVVDLRLVEALIDLSNEMLLEFEKIKYQYELRFFITKLRENASLLWDTLHKLRFVITKLREHTSLLWDTLQWRDNKKTRKKSKDGMVWCPN